MARTPSKTARTASAPRDTRTDEQKQADEGLELMANPTQAPKNATKEQFEAADLAARRAVSGF